LSGSARIGALVAAALAAAVAAGCLLLIGAGHAHAQPAREALLQAAEQALARGDTAAAVQRFEQAALLADAADTEMGQVRASMQAGAYRQALAFCAHTVGEHRDVPAAGALYAWLLRAGGHEAVAQRVMNETAARAPNDAVVQATLRAFASPSGAAAGAMLEAPQRMASEVIMREGQAPPPSTSRVVANGVLIDGGRFAWVPTAALDGARRFWVRNGLGHTTEAIRDEAPNALGPFGITRLRLTAPIDPGNVGDTALAPRDPFAGSPGHAIEYAAAADSAPAWPRLRLGFFGAFEGDGGLRKLGIELPPGPHGGPVFDAAGRLAGIALPSASGQGVMLPASMLRAAMVTAAQVPEPGSASAASAAPAPRVPSDEVYERALRVALQVIVAP
jgi:hypothetical protein